MESLEHISRQMGREELMPTKATADRMHGDLKFKEGQLQNAVVTLARLNKEKEMRNQDLEKILLLDQKVISELDQLKDKINSMKEDLGSKFNSTDELRDKWEDDSRRLNRKIDFMEKKKDILCQQVKSINMA